MSVDIGGNRLLLSGFTINSEISNTPLIITDNLIMWLDAGHNYSSVSGSNYYDCGYGCQYYGSDPGCTACSAKILDMSGNGNDGSLTSVSVLYNNSGGYMYYSGSGTYVTIPYSASMNFSPAQTICMWIQPATGNNTQRRNPYDQAYGGPGTLTYETDASINYYFGTNGGNGSPYVGVNSTFTVGVDELAFITVTRHQANNICRWYKNGILYTDTTAGGYTSGTANGSSDIRLGVGYTTYNFIGTIFAVMVYNKFFTQEEVLQNYYAYLPRFSGEAIVASPSNTPQPSSSPSATPSITPSITPSASPSATPSITPTPSKTPTPTITPSPTPTPSKLAAPMSDVLVCYKFNESSGNIHDCAGDDCTLGTGGTIYYRQPGKTSYSVQLHSSNALNNYLEAQTNCLSLGPPFTWSGWFKITGSTSQNHFLFGTADANCDGYECFFNNAGTRMYFMTLDNCTGYQMYWDLDSTVYNSAWHHFAVVAVNATTVRLYLDGVESPNNPYTHNVYTPFNDNVQIGTDVNKVYGLEGYLSDYAIWSRALSTQEVLQMYNTGSGVGCCSNPPPAASVSPSRTPSPSITPSTTPTPSRTPSATPSPTPSVTPSRTPSTSISPSPSSSAPVTYSYYTDKYYCSYPQCIYYMTSESIDNSEPLDTYWYYCYQSNEVYSILSTTSYSGNLKYISSLRHSTCDDACGDYSC